MTKEPVYTSTGTPCPTPTKRSWWTKRDAVFHAKRTIQDHLRFEHEPHPPIYLYRCPCGALHLTRDTHGPGGEVNELAYEVDVALQAWALGTAPDRL